MCDDGGRGNVVSYCGTLRPPGHWTGFAKHTAEVYSFCVPVASPGKKGINWLSAWWPQLVHCSSHISLTR